MQGNHRAIPKRDLERELQSSGNGPVTTRRMTPEEMEDHFARTGDKRPRDVEGKPVSPPVIQSEPKRKTEPDKRKFLLNIAAGQSIVAIEKAFGMKPNALYYWIKKWDLIGINPKKAKELLGEVAQPPIASEEDIQTRLKAYEQELARLSQADSEKDLLISEMTEDCASWKRVAEHAKSELKGALERIEELQKERDAGEMEARQAITELEEERQLLLETIEKAATPKDCTAPATVVDNVNSPPHYTSGGIETIDFIQAKLNSEEFVGYCKGNALKYVSRANLKGGIESLQKAQWYLNRLLGDRRAEG